MGGWVSARASFQTVPQLVLPLGIEPRHDANLALTAYKADGASIYTTGANLVPLEEFESPTCNLGRSCSVQLSYKG